MSRDKIDEAALWLAAHESGDVDWDEFTAWLEADPGHRRIFDDLAVIEDRVAAHRVELAIGDASVPVHKPAWRWAGVAAGALVAASVALFFAQPRAAPDAIWRSNLTTRTVQVANGIDVRLAPQSELTARRGDPTRLTVKGTAFLTVRHDPTRSLTVAVGPLTVQDIGTRFEATAIPGLVRIAVAEGVLSAAMQDRPSANRRLSAGTSLIDANGGVTVARIDPATIGGWGRGVLTYSEAPLALVAADVARYSGRTVTIDPRLAGARFSGVLTIGDGSGLVTAVAAILGGEARPDGRGGFRLEPRR